MDCVAGPSFEAALRPIADESVPTAVQILITRRNAPAPLGSCTQQTLYPQDSPQLMWASHCFSLQKILIKI
jgi:hypothetical protein